MSDFERNLRKEVELRKEAAAKAVAAAATARAAEAAVESEVRRIDGTDPSSVLGEIDAKLLLDFLNVMKKRGLPRAIRLGGDSRREVPRRGLLGALGYSVTETTSTPIIRGYVIGRVSKSMSPAHAAPPEQTHSSLPSWSSDKGFRMMSGSRRLFEEYRHSRAVIKLGSNAGSYNDAEVNYQVLICEDGKMRSIDGHNLHPDRAFVPGGDFGTSTPAEYEGYATNALYFCPAPLSILLPILAADSLDLK